MRLFSSSGIASFREVTPLLVIPEYQGPLPGGARPSQNDLFVLAKAIDDELVTITIEGKVAEPFGPTLSEWLKDKTKGKARRLVYLKEGSERRWRSFQTGQGDREPKRSWDGFHTGSLDSSMAFMRK